MNQINLLRQTLKPHLGWHGARLSFLALFLIALPGDREFVGKQWFTYLLIEPTISFRLRIRHRDRIHDGKKQLRASIVFANLKPGQTRILSGRQWVWGRAVYVSALRLEDGELLIVVSPDSTTTAISDYGKRWGIEREGRWGFPSLSNHAVETLFGMFKTRGFCLESTHFTDSERLSKLLALMSLALCWAIRMGE